MTAWSDLSKRSTPNRSVNNIPRNIACAYCPVLPSCEPGNPAGHSLLSVFFATVVLLFIPSKPLLLLLETLNASLAELQRTFSWEKFMLLSNRTREVVLSTWEVEYAA